MICKRCKKDREIEAGCARCLECRDKLRAYRQRVKEERPDVAKLRGHRRNHRPNGEAARQRWEDKNFERMREYHKAYLVAWRQANAARVELRKRLQKALDAGKIVKPTCCQACGQEKPVRSWLKVRSLKQVLWYCSKCHARRVAAEK